MGKEAAGNLKANPDANQPAQIAGYQVKNAGLAAACCQQREAFQAKSGKSGKCAQTAGKNNGHKNPIIKQPSRLTARVP